MSQLNTKASKQVIVWRKDLKVSLGKFGSQVAHASIGCILNRMGKEEDDDFAPKGIRLGWKKRCLYYFPDDEVALWINGTFTKILLEVNTEQELLDIYQKAKEAKLNACLIKDNGTTEFDGVATHTCVGIGPNWNEDIDKITGHLKLLKTL